MINIRKSRAVRGLSVLVATGALVTGLAVAPGTASATAGSTQVTVSGLFGTQDPSYDGVFRQGLSILALRAAGVSVPSSAIAWLLRQQCADGGFQAYRSTTRVGCIAPDAANYRGEDTNSTALAVAALSYLLYSNGTLNTTRLAARNRALTWLVKHQDMDGGWAYYPGGGSDANSTGVVLAALNASGVAGGNQHRNGGWSAYNYLRHDQLGCSTPPSQRGALDYFVEQPLYANSSSTAQGAWGLLSKAIVQPGAMTTGSPSLYCTNGSFVPGITVGVAAVTHLDVLLLQNKGAVPSQFGPGTDITTTAFSVLALVASGHGSTAVAQALVVLKHNAAAYVVTGGAYNPGRLAVLILAAHAARQSPYSFGGVNLVARLLGTLGA